ncbi:MAG: hypothetical protein ABSF26_21070 [Thermoguttaceae bacterium]|jgi:hypothetical protein
MADHYLEFSEVLPHLTDAEEQWLRDQLVVVAVSGDGEHVEKGAPDDPDPTAADWRGCRVYRDVPECAEYVKETDLDGPGFEYEFGHNTDEGGCGRHLWVHAGEWGYLDGLAHLVQKFLKRFRPDQCWSLTYATTCSKPRVGEFGGGAVFVTADTIRWQNAYDFVAYQRETFEATASAAESGCTSVVTLDQFTTLMEKAKQESPLGGKTCIYVCLPDVEPVPATGAVLDRSDNGAVFLVTTREQEKNDDGETNATQP